MISKAFSLALMLMLVSTYSYSDAYKCRDADGKITFQSMKCAPGEISSKIKLYSEPKKKKRVIKKVVRKEPSGRWVSIRDNKVKATIAGYGGFEMTDSKGMTVKGLWQTADNSNGYEVKAASQGKAFPINMKYDIAKDSLLLTQPGFPNVYEAFRRR